MKTIQAQHATKNYQTGQTAWTWTDCGDGKLLPVEYYNRSNGRLVCKWGLRESSLNTTSFVVCPDSPCYLFDDDDERERFEDEMRRKLAVRRDRFSNVIASGSLN